MSGDFVVISTEEEKLFRKLKQFYSDVVDLTINHDVMGEEIVEEFDGLQLITGGSAVVYPSKLSEALSKVDPEWWDNEDK